MADLRHLLAIYVHAHQTGNSVPPHIDAEARAALAAEPPAPAPADHVPGARNMVAADGEREELAQWLERIGDDYDDLYRSPSALIRPKLARAAALLRQPAPAPAPADHVPDAGNMVAADGEWEEVAAWLDEEAKRCAVQFYDRITSAAALLLRQLPPEGMEAIRYCVEEDGAVIQRTSRAPESWAIRAGSACMSTTGEWDIEPMPSDRTDEWLANHRWPSAAAAWEALQQARGQEVKA